MISVSEIRREKTTIFFSFYTNSNMRSLCRLMTPNGVSVRTVLFNSEHRQHGQFANVSPKKEYRLQCDIGDDVSKNGGARTRLHAQSGGQDLHGVRKYIKRLCLGIPNGAFFIPE